jgi:hypothetical protein
MPESGSPEVQRYNRKGSDQDAMPNHGSEDEDSQNDYYE